MTKSEINKLLAMMKVNYSYAFKTMSQQEKYLLLNTWTFALQDMDAQVVMIAVMQLISTSKWLPTIAEIREACKDLYFTAAAARADADFDVLPEAQKRTYQYIIDHTCHLRGDGAAGLKLEGLMNPAFLEWEVDAACSPMLGQ